MAKRSNLQADPNNQNSEPLRLRPSPNSETASKLQQARVLMEEIYHSSGIDKTEAGLALKAIDNIRRSCGYPSLGSSRDPWNNTRIHNCTTDTVTTIQEELNNFRKDVDQKFNTLTNLITNAANHTTSAPQTGLSYAEALIQQVNTEQSVGIRTCASLRVTRPPGESPVLYIVPAIAVVEGHPFHYTSTW